MYLDSGGGILLLSGGDKVLGIESKPFSPSADGVSPSSVAPPGCGVRPSPSTHPSCGKAGCCSCTAGTTIADGVSQVKSLVPTTLFAGVSIRNEFRGS